MIDCQPSGWTGMGGPCQRRSGPRPGAVGAAGRYQDSSKDRRPSRAKKAFSLPMSLWIFQDGTWAGMWRRPRKKWPRLKIPTGYRLEWSGEYEYLIKTHERLKMVIPLTALIIFVLIFLNTKSITKTADRPAGRAVLPGRFLLVALSSRLQHEHRRLGGHYRPGRAGCGNRRRHAPLSGSGL